MRSVILGTAGHIDHGKTALVRGLTGVDTDRLKEEKQRGITIELGFAHLGLDEVHFGVVDVPGHERFIKSMVAGAAGIDLVMLVIAADEGVMPQTHEHLDICQLLGVRRGLVALTKVDLVDEEWRELVVDDVRQRLAGTFLEEAAIIPCSAETNEGFDELRGELLKLGREVETRDPSGLLRMPLDRVFSLKGFGTVVTGTLASGSFSAGDEVEVLPGNERATVRSIQVHGKEVKRAVAGQRTAVNLGGVDRHAVSRGEVLVRPNTISPSHIVDVSLSLLPGTRKGLKQRSKVLFHVGTRQQEGSCILLEGKRLEPGQKMLAQLRFEKPVVASPGERFILRGFTKQENYGTTIGGGEILRVLARRLRRKQQDAIALLTQVHGAADAKERVALEVLAAGAHGLDGKGLQQRVPITPPSLERVVGELLSGGTLIRFDREQGSVLHIHHFDERAKALLALVDAHHAQHPAEPGISREELRSRLGGHLPPRLFFALLQRLEKSKTLEAEAELVFRVGHHARASESVGALAERLESLCRQKGLGAPRIPDLPKLLDAPHADVSQALRLLTQQEKLLRVSELAFHRSAVDELEETLRAYLATHETIDAPGLKKLIGQSRKFVIPLAEYFDAQRVTIRIGDVRKLRI
ncbi:MAG: selenocysteine-specific translation elongation factor [Deltaproteobacteria bacterium]|nr:selenocysteine-specific translation elongation factor [Deltaproteobacteria bacterium]